MIDLDEDSRVTPLAISIDTRAENTVYRSERTSFSLLSSSVVFVTDKAESGCVDDGLRSLSAASSAAGNGVTARKSGLCGRAC